MSIATDVSRIKGNITAAMAAIADKGVAVPVGSTSDALAALIESIEAGGGNDPSGILDSDHCEFGTYTVAITSEIITIPTVARNTTHTLKLVMVWAEKDATILGMLGFNGKPNPGEYGVQMLMSISHATVKYSVCKPSTKLSYANFGSGSDSYGGDIGLTVNGARLDPYSTWKFQAGITYNYIIFAKSK